MTDTAPAPVIPRHPAKWSAPILDVIEGVVAGVVAAGPYLSGPTRVADVFAGPSEGVHRFAERWPGEVETVGVELEPEWAAGHPRTIVGDATRLPFANGSIDLVACSPCYGNRMADAHEARDACGTCAGLGVVDVVPAAAMSAEALDAGAPNEGRRCPTCKGEGLSRRNTYRHALGRMPSPGSGAVLHYHADRRGDRYRRLHRAAWREVARVVPTYGRFVVNVSNFLATDRPGGPQVEQRVVEWHLATILGDTVPNPHGDPGERVPLWRLDALIPVETQRQRQGANGDARVPCEFVLVFVRTGATWRA